MGATLILGALFAFSAVGVEVVVAALGQRVRAAGPARLFAWCAGRRHFAGGQALPVCGSGSDSAPVNAAAEIHEGHGHGTRCRPEQTSSRDSSKA